jgi:ADP-ribose pyrophosphatase YjhB (NUDIX family)
VADSTSHAVVGAVLRAREVRLEVLLVGGELPSAPLGPGEALETALGRVVDVRSLAHLEQLETRLLSNGTLATVYLGLVRSDVELAGDWETALSLRRLDADDAAVLSGALSRLRAKLSYTNLGFALAPATFTISELRQIYVAALGHDVSATNLQRVLLRRRVLDRVDGMRPSGRAGGRPAALFRFASQRLEVTDEFAALRPPR